MRKRTKRKIFFANQYELPVIEKFLEREAEKGWMFVRCSGMYYVFEACEPKTVKFQIDYFDKASVFDTNPEQATRDYIEYCEVGGWRHIFSGGKIQIFCSEEENTVPIQTDEQIKLSYLAKATMSVNWCLWFLLPIMWSINIILQLYTAIIRPYSPFVFSRFITMKIQQGLVLFYILFTILAAISFIRFCLFYFKNKKQIKEGYAIQYYSEKNTKVFNTFYVCYLLLLTLFLMWSVIDRLSVLFFFFVFILGIIGLIFGITKLTYAKWANRQTNIAIYITLMVLFYGFISGVVIVGVVGFLKIDDKTIESNQVTYFYSFDEIDLTLEQLGVKKPDESLYEERCSEKSKSLLGSREEYSDFYYLDEDNKEAIGYRINIFSSQFDAIAKKYESLLGNLDKGMEVYKWGDCYVILDSNLGEELNTKIIQYYQQQNK